MSDALLPLRLRDLLHVADVRQASDVHVHPGCAPALRVDGALSFIEGAAIEAAEAAALARLLLGETRVRELSHRHDVTAMWCDERARRIRVHAFEASAGICLSLRLYRQAAPTLVELGLPGAVAPLAARNCGLVIFAGPTGSGKSSSLAAFVAEINRSRACRIVTIEDPVEFHFSRGRALISQRELGRDAESFADAIVGALRADPDVIMIGETREASTMRALLMAAETGHLVVTTLHTGSAAQTIDRIVDAFEGSQQRDIRAQLARALAAVVCQRLVPRGSGQGRALVADILIANDAVRNVIREGRTHQLENAALLSRDGSDESGARALARGARTAATHG